MSMFLDEVNHNKLKKLVIRHLEIDSEMETDEITQETIESWDSSRNLSLIMEIEAEFGTAFKIEEVTEMESFDDIAYYLSQKL